MRTRYLSNPDYNFEKVNRASMACGPMVKWAIAQVRDNFIFCDLTKSIFRIRLPTTLLVNSYAFVYEKFLFVFLVKKTIKNIKLCSFETEPPTLE